MAKSYTYPPSSAHLSIFPCCQSLNCRSLLSKTPLLYANELTVAKRLCRYFVENEPKEKRKMYKTRLKTVLPNITILNIKYFSVEHAIVTFKSYKQEYFIGNTWAFFLDYHVKKIFIVKSSKDSIELTKERVNQQTNYFLTPFFKLWDTRYRIDETTQFYNDIMPTPKFKLNNVIETRENHRYKIIHLSRDNHLANIQDCRSGTIYLNYYLSNTRRVYKTYTKNN